MKLFSIEAGTGGAGSGSYACGLLTLANGETRGVEAIARLTARDDSLAARGFSGFLGSLRGVLPLAGRLPMPARLAVSTVRAGLGVIEEGLAPDGADPASVELAFADGTMITARMPATLIALIRRDRDVALGAVARATRTAVAAAAQPLPDDGTAEALTSIFRYEKRNGRLRRVAEPDAKT